jgi:capsular polysaccharide export protein
MKILCLSTLDKFSRFYLDIERQLGAKIKSDINLKVYSIYLSGFLYTWFRFKFSCWISVKAWFLVKRKKDYYTTIINETITYKGILFNDYITFHLGLNKNISSLSLQLQALAYIDIFDIIFSKEQPDCIISIGDSRLCIEIAIALAKQRKIKTYYIEQGPFNTTFFDDTGVNANLSIRNQTDFDVNSIPNSIIDLDIKPKSIKYRRSPIYRGLDMLLMRLFELHNLYPPDLKFTDLNSSRFKKNKPTENEFLKKSNHPNILLVLQVPLDVNMIYHSPIFKSHLEIIKSIVSNLPINTTLIVREHPLYINKYERSLYDFVKENGIIIDNTTALNKAIEFAEVVIVNNSTVGIEAILNYKTTVVLGNAFYDHTNICLKLRTENELEALLEKALTYAPNKEEINDFKRLLSATVLLEGSITDKDLKSSKHIANHLLAHH